MVWISVLDANGFVLLHFVKYPRDGVLTIDVDRFVTYGLVIGMLNMQLCEMDFLTPLLLGLLLELI